MIKQILIPLGVVALFIIIVGVLTRNPATFGLGEENKQKSVTIEGHKINLEVASTDAQRQQGLGDRKELPENSGMLFVFDTQNVRPIFWMKDMLIDIDIVWINDNEIVKIDRDAKAPQKGTPDSELIKYPINTDVDYVLELNAGYTEKNGINVGSQTQFDL